VVKRVHQHRFRYVRTSRWFNGRTRGIPEDFGSFQTAHKRLIRWAVDGTWEKILAAVLATADAVDDISSAPATPTTIAQFR
jgi:hypothetical protein